MATNTSRRLAAVALGSAVLVTAGTVSSHAEHNPGPGPSQTAATEWRDAGKDGRAARWAACEATVNSPHWSKKAKTVLFKTRVSCKGNIPRVHVKVTGRLYRKSGSGWKAVVGSKETRTKATNGGKSTFYTPRGNNKVRLDGTYQGKITVQITSPVPGSKGRAASQVAKVNTPGK